MTGLPLVLYWIGCGVFGYCIGNIKTHWTIKVALALFVPAGAYLLLKGVFK